MAVLKTLVGAVIGVSMVLAVVVAVGSARAADAPEPKAIARRSSSYVELEKFLHGLWQHQWGDDTERAMNIRAARDLGIFMSCAFIFSRYGTLADV